MKGTASGGDSTDLQDQRDKMLVSLSERPRASARRAAADGGMSIYTDSGVTLFQGIAAHGDVHADDHLHGRHGRAGGQYRRRAGDRARRP